MRPSNCRERLREEGEPYPRSNCWVCGTLIRPNWQCPWKGDREADCARLESGATLPSNEGSNPSPSANLEQLKQQRFNIQQEIDALMVKIVSMNERKQSLTYEINKLKRLTKNSS